MLAFTWILQYLYCNWHQFVFWVHVEQTETSSHVQRFTIIGCRGNSIHLLLVIKEHIAFLERHKKEVFKTSRGIAEL